MADLEFWSAVFTAQAMYGWRLGARLFAAIFFGVAALTLVIALVGGRNG